jgi:pimeloyl-ACP methyl ester carboxylesterase
VAPDLRGYGDTEAPASVSSYTIFHLVGDIVALIDSLGVDQVFLVAHDWGAMIGWYVCLFRPERIKAYVCLSVPFLPRNPKVKPVDGMRALFGDDYYICRFQVPFLMFFIRYIYNHLLHRVLLFFSQISTLNHFVTVSN